MTQCPIIPCIKKGKWKVYKNYTYTTKAGIAIRIKEGFETDLASIPSFFQWLFPKCRVDYATASVVHDWLLVQGMGRAYANKIFKEILDITSSEEIEEVFYGAVSFWSKVKWWIKRLK